MILPRALRPGDRIAVFAGSSPFDATLAWRGLGWLRERYDVVFDRSLFARHGFLAGDDARRRDELQRALSGEGVRALIAVRGGYGLGRIAPTLDLGSLREDPRWIVGFSDVTALHVEAARLGIASLHGPMVAALGRGDARGRSRWIDALERPGITREFSSLRGVYSGAAEGPLVGGNLAILHDCAASGRLRIPEGAILLLEDVTERPYRVDRMLTALIAGGHLATVAGVLLGDWTGCSPGPDGVTTESVLRERLSSLRVPVVAGAPIGHGDRNEPVVLGARWRIESVTTDGESRAVQVATTEAFG